MAIGPVPTITVANKHGHKMTINEADFDPAVHEVWSDEKHIKARAPEAAKAESDSEARRDIGEASSLAGVAKAAAKHGLKMPGNIKKVDTAKRNLLRQLEE